MFEYYLWGATVISDIEIDINDDKVKRQLIEAKAELDCNGDITVLMIIKNNTVTAVGDWVSGIILQHPHDVRMTIDSFNWFQPQAVCCQKPSNP